MSNAALPKDPWPELDWQQWQQTADTLHMLLQIVGKTRLELTPVQNHWWNVSLYVTARGLTTSAMPTPQGGVLEIEFDFIAHQLHFRLSSGETKSLALQAQTVADFFAAYQQTMTALGIACAIDPMPCELKQPIRFDRDTTHATYDADAVHRYWQVLGRADALLKRFSTNFYGKIRPVHLFWGSFDLAVTRFNGKPAPPRPGADAIQAEAYSHECISSGFWPGNGGYGQAAFYCYAAPVPAGLAESRISAPGAFNQDLGEFLLNYEDLRRSSDPDRTLLTFLAETYSVAADAAGWDRASLDRRDAIGDAAIRIPAAQASAGQLEG